MTNQSRTQQTIGSEPQQQVAHHSNHRLEEQPVANSAQPHHSVHHDLTSSISRNRDGAIGSAVRINNASFSMTQAPGKTCLITLIRSLPATGLTSQPVAPSRLPSLRFEASLSVVRVRIGMKRKVGSARTLPMNSNPPI